LYIFKENDVQHTKHERCIKQRIVVQWVPVEDTGVTLAMLDI